MKIYDYANDYAAQEKAKQQRVASAAKEVEHVKNEPETVTSGTDELSDGRKEQATGEGGTAKSEKPQEAGSKKKKK